MRKLMIVLTSLIFFISSINLANASLCCDCSDCICQEGVFSIMPKEDFLTNLLDNLRPSLEDRDLSYLDELANVANEIMQRDIIVEAFGKVVSDVAEFSFKVFSPTSLALVNPNPASTVNLLKAVKDYTKFAEEKLLLVLILNTGRAHVEAALQIQAEINNLYSKYSNGITDPNVAEHILNLNVALIENTNAARAFLKPIVENYVAEVERNPFFTYGYYWDKYWDNIHLTKIFLGVDFDKPTDLAKAFLKQYFGEDMETVADLLLDVFSLSVEGKDTIDALEKVYEELNNNSSVINARKIRDTATNYPNSDTNPHDYTCECLCGDCNTKRNEIPSYASSFSDNTYVVFNIGMTWHEAKAYCESLGGHLATISNAEENAYIAELASGYNFYWLGATDKINGQWEWVTGETWSYSNWASGQPDNKSLTGKEEGYLTLSKVHGNKYDQWNDLSSGGDGDPNGCDLSNGGFICEWEKDIAIPMPESMPANNEKLLKINRPLVPNDTEFIHIMVVMITEQKMGIVFDNIIKMSEFPYDLSVIGEGVAEFQILSVNDETGETRLISSSILDFSY